VGLVGTFWGSNSHGSYFYIENIGEDMTEKCRFKFKITESDVIRAINDYLQIQRNQGKLMYIRNNSGAMPISDGKNKRRYIRFGDKGSPDFFVFETLWLTRSMKAVEAIAIEAKSETGKLSTDQLKWQADFVKLGGVYYVVRSIEEVIKILE